MNKSIRLDITQDNRTKLKAEFDQLESIEQKYSFWSEKLERNYFHWSFYEQEDIQDFEIIPKNESETEILNKLIYSDYSLVVSSVKNIYNRRESFIVQMETATDKETLIEYELKNIDDLIFKRKQVSISDDMFQHEKNNFFIVGYEGYLLKKKEIDWKERVYQAHLLMEKIHGIQCAKYREFVKNYKAPTKRQTSIQLNGEQKFLVLHHLGFGKEIKVSARKAKLFDPFIDDLRESTIRPMFSDVKKYETEENLYTLLNYFRFIKLDSKVNDIQLKLDKLKKKR